MQQANHQSEDGHGSNGWAGNGTSQFVIVRALHVQAGGRSSVGDLLVHNNAVTQSIETFMRGLAHAVENVAGRLRREVILLEEDFGQSFDMLTSQSDILFRVHGDIKHGDALLDADANLKGVGRQLVHGNFDGSSTTSVVFGQASKVIDGILTDSVVSFWKKFNLWVRVRHLKNIFQFKKS